MKPYYYKTLMGSLAVMLSASVFGHGLISEPASRNWTCGAITKPDQAQPGSICAQAFEDDFNGGYQFMSVLTHTQGRAVVDPLPENVCSFGTSTWNGQATPWDKPLDWPAHEIEPGPLTLTWDISWGPHWDDTEEFRYWITKPDFQYQVGRALTWDDFEEEAFCVLGYDDNNPNANPNVWTERSANLFHTQCQVPERAGRHVIYAEWGRNEWTYERFHTCVDVQIGGDGGGGDVVPVVADIQATPDTSVFVGDGQIALDASNSQGNNLSYQWSVDAVNPSLYSLSSASGSSTVLTLAEPAAESQVTVHLQVTGQGASSSTSVSFTHVPAAGDSNWIDLGAVSGQANALSAGDQVQLRLVDSNGVDTYYPANALVLTEATAGANAWPYALAQAVNSEASNIRIGALDANGDVNPAQSATANRIYATAPASYNGAFVLIQDGGNGDGGNGEEPGAGSCEYVVVDDWGAGFVANIRITNNGSTPINGWTVNWEYSGNTTMTNGWNAEFSGSNPYSASNTDWNGEIQPGDTVEFGFQGEGSAEAPEVTGNVCD